LNESSSLLNKKQLIKSKVTFMSICRAQDLPMCKGMVEIRAACHHHEWFITSHRFEWDV